MAALKDLHRKLHSRTNEDLTNRENSPDDYNTNDLQARSESSNKQEAEGTLSQKNNFNISDKAPLNALEKTQSNPLTNDYPEMNGNGNKKDGMEGDDKWYKTKKFKIAVSVICFLLLLIGGWIGYVRYKQKAFSPENIKIEFVGNYDVQSGDKMACKILLNNANRVGLSGAVLKVFYPEELKPVKTSFMREGPEGSFYIDVKNIAAQEIKEYEIGFEVYSPFDNQVYLNTEFSYQPDNFSSNFTKEDNQVVTTKGSIIGFSLVSQKEVSSGETVKFIGVLTNNSTKDFDNLVLSVDYPEGFSFEGSGLEMVNKNKDNLFKIARLKAGEKMEIDLLGSFMGNVDSIKRVSAEIGVLGESESISVISMSEESIKIIPSRISVSQEVLSGINKEKLTVRSGGTIRHRVNFKNNSSSPLFDLILKERLEGILIDRDRVSVTNGYYDKDKNEIIWKASDVPALKLLNPGESGFVEFEYTLKENYVPKDTENQTVSSQAKISSSNIESSLPSGKEINSTKSTFKLKTDLQVLLSGSYGEGVFKNFGPMPVKIGEETTFTVKVSLKNSFNKIRKPSLTIQLPSGIIWKDSFHRSSGDVSFNERSNELTWKINYIYPQTGYEKLDEELIFQIGYIPQANTGGKSDTLVKEASLVGIEEFVDEPIDIKTKEFRLSDIDDYDF